MAAPNNLADDSSRSPRDDDQVFTEHITLIRSGREDRKNGEAVRKKLLRIAKSQIHKKGIIKPGYLGISMQPDWDDDAYEELICLCYERAFIDRRQRLIEYVERGDTIDPCVTRIVEQLIHDLQKKVDPDGYKRFKQIESAIGLLHKEGNLHSSDRLALNEEVVLATENCQAALDTLALQSLVQANDIWSVMLTRSVPDKEVAEALLEVISSGSCKFGELLAVIRERAPSQRKIKGITQGSESAYGESDAVGHPEDPEELSETRYDAREALEVDIERLKTAIKGLRRTKKVKQRLLDLIAALKETPSLTVPEICKKLGVSKTTYYHEMTQLQLLGEQVTRGE